MPTYYTEILYLWKRLCEVHSQLFDLTCDEYSVLLSGEIDKLQDISIEKEKHLKIIEVLNAQRLDIIKSMSQNVQDCHIESVNDLIVFMHKYEENKLEDEKLFDSINNLLISIIEKIKEQNSMNQSFLSSSIQSFRLIQRGLKGIGHFKTYNAKGKTE